MYIVTVDRIPVSPRFEFMTTAVLWAEEHGLTSYEVLIV